MLRASVTVILNERTRSVRHIGVILSEPDAQRSATEGSLSLQAVHQPWRESDPSLRSG
jgi:hypothetical protein